MNVGLIFGMIVAIMVIGMIFVFGYQQISNVTEIQKTAEFKRALRDLEISVDRVYSMGGESNDIYSLSFPSTVKAVCFFPKYDELFNTKRPYTISRIRTEIRNLVDLGNPGKEYELANNLANMRIAGGVDKNYTLLIFYITTSVPGWFEMEHLEPVKKNNEIVCTHNSGDVWFVRNFDDDGAWVEAELPEI